MKGKTRKEEEERSEERGRRGEEKREWAKKGRTTKRKE